MRGSIKKESFSYFITDDNMVLGEEISMSVAIKGQLPKGITQAVVTETVDNARNTMIVVVVIQLCA